MVEQDVLEVEESALQDAHEAEWQLPAGDELPEGWTLARIGDVCQTGARSINPQDAPNEVFEYYSIPAFQAYAAPMLESGERILSNKLLVERGTVLFGKLNPRVLKVWLVNPIGTHRAIASTEFLPVLANTRAEPGFLYYVCQSGFVVQEARRLVSGSTPSRQRVDPGAFYNIIIPLAPLLEQRAIAHTLRAVQDAIQTRRREVELERERKAALMQHLFTYGTRDEPTKVTVIGEMPESWQLARLGDLATFKNGINFSSGQKGTGILTVDVLNMYGDGLYAKTETLYRVNMSVSPDMLLQPGDVLFVRSSLKQEGVGWPALFAGHSEPVTFCGFIIRARLNSPAVTPSFLMNFLRLPKVRAHLVSKSGKVAITNINQASLSGLPTPIPTSHEQRDIADMLSACDAKIAAMNREVDFLDELFRALLEELMTGRVMVGA